MTPIRLTRGLGAGDAGTPLRRSVAVFLKPDPDSEDEAYIVDDSPVGAGEVRGITEFPIVRYTNVRRELAADFVAQAQTRIEL